MRLKAIYIISHVDKALAFEWLSTRIDHSIIDLRFILIGRKETPLSLYLQQKGIATYTIEFDEKKDFVKTWLRVYGILKKEKPQVVHTHLYYANVIGLSSAFLLRIRKRIQTRHHASIHHQYFPRAVYIDKILNLLSTDIIVLSGALKQIVEVWEGASVKKIHLIPHGFDTEYFRHADPERIEALRARYGIPGKSNPVIGVISRYTEWKGVQFIIPAFENILLSYPTAHLVLANAQGDYADTIKQLLRQLPEGSYTEIHFESDLVSLYGLFDIFVHAPVDAHSEAFGQTYVEALAAGVPSVFTLSGIAGDFIIDEKNALIVPFKNAEAIADAVLRILRDPVLRKNLIDQGRASVHEKFSLEKMIGQLQQIYLLTPAATG